MIVYDKLWRYMWFRYNWKRSMLLHVISSPTLAKLGKNENVNVEVIDRICEFLKCQPSDIMEYINSSDFN